MHRHSIYGKVKVLRAAQGSFVFVELLEAQHRGKFYKNEIAVSQRLLKKP